MTGRTESVSERRERFAEHVRSIVTDGVLVETRVVARRLEDGATVAEWPFPTIGHAHHFAMNARPVTVCFYVVITPEAKP